MDGSIFAFFALSNNCAILILCFCGFLLKSKEEFLNMFLPLNKPGLQFQPRYNENRLVNNANKYLNPPPYTHTRSYPLQAHPPHHLPHLPTPRHCSQCENNLFFGALASEIKKCDPLPSAHKHIYFDIWLILLPPPHSPANHYPRNSVNTRKT